MKKIEQQKVNEMILDELQYGFSCQKKIHQGWIEQQQLKEFYKKVKKKTGFTPSQLFGKWQYVYHSTKGDISLIRIRTWSFKNPKKDRWIWEIYAHGNPKLFTDTMRFDTKKKAEEAIKGYLC